MGISKLIFYVNGRKVTEENADPEMSLLTYLRRKLRLTGSKLGCGEGGCGACTVMVSKYDKKYQTLGNMAINACLVPVCSLHGSAVTTIEGIGSIRNGLHPIQERIIKYHGSQCGFCTPGIVMKMYSLLRNQPYPTEQQIQKAFQGNLCRCTGYRPILEAFRTFSKECCQSQSCCKSNTGATAEELNATVYTPDLVPLEATQDPIFPPELMVKEFDKDTLLFVGERVTYHRPTSLDDLLDLKSEYSDAVLVAGNTEVGIEMGVKKKLYSRLINLAHIPELKIREQKEDSVILGSAVTLSEMEQFFKDINENLPEHKTRALVAFVEMIQWFAGDQIRNVATLGGNIMTSSPISDLIPLLTAMEAKLVLKSKCDGMRTVEMDKNWFISYRKTAIRPHEVLVSILIPLTKKNEFVFGYKQSHRKEDDIAIVNAGMRVSFDMKNNSVEKLHLVFGGMSDKAVIASRTMNMCEGRYWDESLLNDVLKMLPEELPLSTNSPGGMVEYRQTLALSFFFKFFAKVQTSHNKMNVDREFHPLYESMPNTHDCELKSIQVYEEVPNDQPVYDEVGRGLPHASGFKQATGEAIYVDDMPRLEGELYLSFVTSTKAHATIISIDTTYAKQSPGFVDYIDSKSVDGSNLWGFICDDEYFASEKVTCVGQIIGAIVADTKEHAERAAQAVIIQYEGQKPIISIEDAIDADSFYEDVPPLKHGNVELGFSRSENILEGEIYVGGQDHFYLETQSVIAVPKNEDSEIELFVSTQNPTQIQNCVAKALGIASNKVAVRVKRLGGGFGGKETRSAMVAIPTALAALRHRKPVRCVLDRQEDMAMIGKRHSFLGRYKVGFMNDGKISTLQLELFSNAGNSLDLSAAVMTKAIMSCTNCYKIPNMYVQGRMCKTNIFSSTAFRGFGAPQAMLISETWIDHVSSYLQIDPVTVRKLNLYQEGDIPFHKQILENCTIQKCWDECLAQSDYTNRKIAVDEYNRLNRYIKRGIAVVPTMFGVGYSEAIHMNQAGALVHIYTDGSVLLSHGGVEMGQGLHTKMLQIASRALEISMKKIHISETNTGSVPNTTPTAASLSSDLNGMAVLNACKKLLKRLRPYKALNRDGSWDDWVAAAYEDRVSLSATGFYKMPDINFDNQTYTGRPFDYFCNGAACSEVEIDCLTGDHRVIRTDIVMDVGQSLNPSIDIGQIEGAFIQGYGLFMLEQLKISPDGFVYTTGPGSYKIPGFNNIPSEFNVSFLQGSKNPRAVYSSKAVGEPPLFLSASVFFATKDAISSARRDAGDSNPFQLDSPATPEKIRMACKDNFIKQIRIETSDPSKPWFIDRV